MLTADQQQWWLGFWLFIWVMVLCLVIRSLWSKKLPSVGLPLLYLFSLSILHFFGGFIYYLPWYRARSAYLLSTGSNLNNTYLGFNQSVYGVVAFGIGTIFLALLGLLFILVIAPILARIPGFSAIITSGISLFLVGLCLGCWQAWCSGDGKAFGFWLLVTFSLPLFTVLILGFIGFGVGASLVVLIFVFNFYRPRWKITVMALLGLYIGLSIFVNYLRDRTEIRSTVWGGQDSYSRIEQVQKTVRKFELFNLFKQEHLETIDTRLNQNVLVGQTVSYMKAGKIDFAQGQTLQDALLSAIPRFLWPTKPVVGGSGNIVSKYAGIKFATGTSVGVGSILELYINFGSWGIICGLLFLGTVIRIVDITAAQKLIHGNWVGMMTWFVPGLNLVQPGGSLSEVVASTSAAIILVFLINRVYLKKANRVKIFSPELHT
jgi:hypothetical protein